MNILRNYLKNKVLLERTDAYLKEISEEKQRIASNLEILTKNVHIHMETINESSNELQDFPRTSPSQSILFRNKLSFFSIFFLVYIIACCPSLTQVHVFFLF